MSAADSSKNPPKKTQAKDPAVTGAQEVDLSALIAEDLPHFDIFLRKTEPSVLLTEPAHTEDDSIVEAEYQEDDGFAAPLADTEDEDDDFDEYDDDFDDTFADPSSRRRGKGEKGLSRMPIDRSMDKRRVGK